VVSRFDHWQNAVNLFHHHTGVNNLQLIKKLARDERIRLTFDQLPVCIFVLFKIKISLLSIIGAY
jgi:hypothetical protein